VFGHGLFVIKTLPTYKREIGFVLMQIQISLRWFKRINDVDSATTDDWNSSTFSLGSDAHFEGKEGTRTGGVRRRRKEA
jgi:hypothetical protein